MISLTRMSNPSKAFNRYCEVPSPEGAVRLLEKGTADKGCGSLMEA